MYCTQGMFQGLWLLGPPLGPVYRVASGERRAKAERDASWDFRPQGKLPMSPEMWGPPLGAWKQTSLSSRTFHPWKMLWAQGRVGAEGGVAVYRGVHGGLDRGLPGE